MIAVRSIFLFLNAVVGLQILLKEICFFYEFIIFPCYNMRYKQKQAIVFHNDL